MLVPFRSTFTKSHCGYCKRAKAALDDIRATYEEYDLERNPEVYPELELRLRRVRTHPHPLTVPQVFRYKEYIGGCDDLLRWLTDKRRR